MPLYVVESAGMNTASDNVLVTFAQVVELFKVSPGAVRAWVAAGRLEPVRRQGKGGGGGRMWFCRGAVSNLVHGACPACGNGFRRVTQSQKFCSTLCRQRFARMHKREP